MKKTKKGGEMKKITLRKISFGSYMKLFTTNGVVLGVVVGLPFLIIAICGGDVEAHIGDFRLSGVPGGVLALFMSPVLTGCAFALCALLAFLPFKLILRVSKFMKLNVLMTEAETKEENAQAESVE